MLLSQGTPQDWPIILAAVGLAAFSVFATLPMIVRIVTQLVQQALYLVVLFAILSMALGMIFRPLGGLVGQVGGAIGSLIVNAFRMVGLGKGGSLFKQRTHNPQRDDISVLTVWLRDSTNQDFNVRIEGDLRGSSIDVGDLITVHGTDRRGTILFESGTNLRFSRPGSPQSGIPIIAEIPPPMTW